MMRRGASLITQSQASEPAILPRPSHHRHMRAPRPHARLRRLINGALAVALVFLLWLKSRRTGVTTPPKQAPKFLQLPIYAKHVRVLPRASPRPGVAMAENRYGADDVENHTSRRLLQLDIQAKRKPRWNRLYYTTVEVGRLKPARVQLEIDISNALTWVFCDWSESHSCNADMCECEREAADCKCRKWEWHECECGVPNCDDDHRSCKGPAGFEILPMAKSIVARDAGVCGIVQRGHSHLQRADEAGNRCPYSLRYHDGDRSKGYLVKDKFSMRNMYTETKVSSTTHFGCASILYNCHQSTSTWLDDLDGVLGLTKSEVGLPQILSQNRIIDESSLVVCLDRGIRLDNEVGYLRLGSTIGKGDGVYQAPMVEFGHNHFRADDGGYFTNILQVSYGDKYYHTLSEEASQYVLFSTSIPYTHVVDEIYQKIIYEVHRQAQKKGYILDRVLRGVPEPFDICYNAPRSREYLHSDSSLGSSSSEDSSWDTDSSDEESSDNEAYEYGGLGHDVGPRRALKRVKGSTRVRHNQYSTESNPMYKDFKDITFYLKCGMDCEGARDTVPFIIEPKGYLREMGPHYICLGIMPFRHPNEDVYNIIGALSLEGMLMEFNSDANYIAWKQSDCISKSDGEYKEEFKDLGYDHRREHIFQSGDDIRDHLDNDDLPVPSSPMTKAHKSKRPTFDLDDDDDDEEETDLKVMHGKKDNVVGADEDVEMVDTQIGDDEVTEYFPKQDDYESEYELLETWGDDDDNADKLSPAQDEYESDYEVIDVGTEDGIEADSSSPNLLDGEHKSDQEVVDALTSVETSVERSGSGGESAVKVSSQSSNKPVLDQTSSGASGDSSSDDSSGDSEDDSSDSEDDSEDSEDDSEDDEPSPKIPKLV